MKAKKVLAMLMASAMIMGTTVTAFAAETANIRVNGLNDDATISYVQVVEPDTKSPLGWKFVDEAEGETPDGDITNAFKTAFGVDTADEAIQELISLGKLETKTNANATAGTINSSVELSKALTAVEDKAIETAGVSRHTITNIGEAGLYVVKATSIDADYTYIPMLAYVEDKGSGDLQNVTVAAKGSYDIIQKSLDNPESDSSVSEGDEVEYTATVTYPYYSADTELKTFNVTDTLTNGTFKRDSIVITVDMGTESVTLQPGTDYTAPVYETTEDGEKLTIDFTSFYNSNYAGKTMTIKYTAIVGDGNDNMKNEIETNFDEEGDSIQSDEVAVKVKKTEDDTTTTIQGAEFTIYEAVTEPAEGYDTFANVSVVTRGEQVVDNTTLYLKVADDVRTTNESGELTFVGLDADKTYYVKETDAPTGYQLNEYYYAVGTTTKADSSTDKVIVYNDFADLTVINQNLSSLPSTGGIGTTIFTIGGCAIMVTAAGLYFATRKKEQN